MSPTLNTPMNSKESLVSAIKNFIFENGSYKLVALFVTLILWITLMSRRDFEMSADVRIEFLVPKNFIVKSSNYSTVKVNIEGARSALRQFQREDRPLFVDLTNAGQGHWVRRMSPQLFNLPPGIRIIGVQPQSIEIDLAEKNQDL